MDKFSDTMIAKELFFYHIFEEKAKMTFKNV
jgi:hypothetical protein